MRSIRAASRWGRVFLKRLPTCVQAEDSREAKSERGDAIVRENIELIAWLFLCVLYEIVGTIVVSVYG
jgi:hypothetical protein